MKTMQKPLSTASAWAAATTLFLTEDSYDPGPHSWGKRRGNPQPLPTTVVCESMRKSGDIEKWHPMSALAYVLEEDRSWDRDDSATSEAMWCLLSDIANRNKVLVPSLPPTGGDRYNTDLAFQYMLQAGTHAELIQNISNYLTCRGFGWPSCLAGWWEPGNATPLAVVKTAAPVIGSIGEEARVRRVRDDVFKRLFS